MKWFNFPTPWLVSSGISVILWNLFLERGFFYFFPERDRAFGKAKRAIGKEWAEMKGFKTTLMEFLNDCSKRIVLRLQMKHFRVQKQWNWSYYLKYFSVTFYLNKLTEVDI